MSKKRVLVVEDDEALAQVVCHNLEYEGFEVQCVGDGDVALAAARTFAPDLVLLDLMLPGTGGMDLCAMWSDERRFPIIMMTSRDRKDDKLRGLQIGADDYVTKPFDLEELLARIHAVLRRSRPRIERLTLGAVVIDFVNVTAHRGHAVVDLTHREFALLRYLAERANTVVLRDELLRNLWGFAEEPATRSVDRAIARLRKKIEPHPHRPTYIHTAHGDGYSLSPGETRGAEESASPSIG